MIVIEEYHKFVERDFNEISLFWKLIQILLHLTGACSGYCTGIMFYTFWHDIFEGNCPIRAKLHGLSRTDDNDVEDKNVDRQSLLNETNWQELIVIYRSWDSGCEMFHAVTLISSSFGVVWLAFFSICGRGGNDFRFSDASWSIVVPALIFDSIFALIAMVFTYDMQQGYLQFSHDMYSLFMKIVETNVSTPSFYRECDIVQAYIQKYEYHDQDVCKLFLALQIFAWTMALSWLGGFLVLFLRIVLVVDFRLLRIKIYQLPRPTTSSRKKVVFDSGHPHIDKNKRI